MEHSIRLRSARYSVAEDSVSVDLPVPPPFVFRLFLLFNIVLIKSIHHTNKNRFNISYILIELFNGMRLLIRYSYNFNWDSFNKVYSPH